MFNPKEMSDFERIVSSIFTGACLTCHPALRKVYDDYINVLQQKGF